MGAHPRVRPRFRDPGAGRPRNGATGAPRPAQRHLRHLRLAGAGGRGHDGHRGGPAALRPRDDVHRHRGGPRADRAGPGGASGSRGARCSRATRRSDRQRRDGTGTVRTPPRPSGGGPGAPGNGTGTRFSRRRAETRPRSRFCRGPSHCWAGRPRTAGRSFAAHAVSRARPAPPGPRPARPAPVPVAPLAPLSRLANERGMGCRVSGAVPLAVPALANSPNRRRRWIVQPTVAATGEEEGE